jgi:predicted transcriptional regulator
MSNEPEYVKQLRELYKAYTGRELEAALGVTTRSIQNYIKEAERTTPSNPTINKIRELFAKHAKGEKLEIKNPDRSDQDLKDKYIQLLERMDREKTELLEKVSLSLSLLPKSNEALTDLILQGQVAVAQKIEDSLNKNLKELSKKIDSLPLNVPDKKQVSKGKH